MGCNCTKTVREESARKGNSGNEEADDEPKGPQTLCFAAEDLVAFGQEFTVNNHNAVLANIAANLRECQVSESDGRTQIISDEDAERGYLFFELDDKWEQAQLEDDLRRGVIPQDRFVVPHRDEFENYMPPFVQSQPQKSLSGRSMSGHGKWGVSQSQNGNSSARLHPMANEFEQEMAQAKNSGPASPTGGILDGDDSLSDDGTRVIVAFQNAKGKKLSQDGEEVGPKKFGILEDSADSWTVRSDWGKNRIFAIE
uniref:Uncharacterized protein n=1 Tax=Eutreptiella gymnastica TaxID=73025 RepID=A0A6T2D907_9EUGL